LQFIFIRVEIDRGFGGLDRLLVQRLYYLSFVQKPQNRRFYLEFQFEFFLRDHDFVIKQNHLNRQFPSRSSVPKNTQRDFLALDQKIGDYGERPLHR
jgi:hypothetical protein